MHITSSSQYPLAGPSLPALRPQLLFPFEHPQHSEQTCGLDHRRERLSPLESCLSFPPSRRPSLLACAPMAHSATYNQDKCYYIPATVYHVHFPSNIIQSNWHHKHEQHSVTFVSAVSFLRLQTYASPFRAKLENA